MQPELNASTRLGATALPETRSDATGDSILQSPQEGEDIEAFVQRQQEMLREKESAAIASLRQTKLAKSEVEVLTQHLVETVKADAMGAAQVLRTWLTEDRR